jgi:hypothetical protein
VRGLARRAASDAGSESFAGDSLDSRSIRRGEAQKSAHVQKKILPRFRVCAACFATAFARTEPRRPVREIFYDKIVTAEKPLFHRHFCNRLFV